MWFHSLSYWAFSRHKLTKFRPCCLGHMSEDAMKLPPQSSSRVELLLLAFTLPTSVARRQIKGLALLNSTDNICAFCIHEKSPIIYWFSITLCLGDLRLPLIPITGNTVPLSRETISHLSALQENMRKHLPGLKAGEKAPSFCLPHLASALPFVSPPCDLYEGVVAAEATAQQS